MAISMEMIKDLRQRTGAGIMECKEALKESNMDMEAAQAYLRKKGASKAAKKAERSAKEGVIAAFVDGATASILEIKCETDFVARNETFQGLASSLAEHVAANDDAPDESGFLGQTFKGNSSLTVKELLSNKVFEMGENIVVGRRAKLGLQGPGLFVTYIHGVGNIGVILEVGAESDETASKPEVTEMGKDIAMQIAAMNPVAMRPEEIPADIIEREKDIYTAQARESGKPENIIPKIVEGGLKKFYSESCLLSQAFVKDNKKNIQAVVNETAKQAGGALEIRRFVRYQLGE